MNKKLKNMQLAMKKFSCKYYFKHVDKDKVFRKYYVDMGKKPKACEPDFEESDENSDYAPEEHLKNVHGFLSKAPEKKRRSLEIDLCKSIESKLVSN